MNISKLCKLPLMTFIPFFTEMIVHGRWLPTMAMPLNGHNRLDPILVGRFPSVIGRSIAACPEDSRHERSWALRPSSGSCRISLRADGGQSAGKRIGNIIGWVRG